MPSQHFMHFERGSTFFGGAPDNATDEDGILGEEIEIRDSDHDSGRMRRYRIVRNSSGIAIESRRLVTLNAAGNAITGYAIANSNVAYPVDDQLGSVTVAANDICLVGVGGPHLVLTDLANVAADLAAGDYVVPQTAATSQATTAGRFVLQPITSSVTVAQTTARGVFGQAISTSVTDNTNTAVLIDIKARQY